MDLLDLAEQHLGRAGGQATTALEVDLLDDAVLHLETEKRDGCAQIERPKGAGVITGRHRRGEDYL